MNLVLVEPEELSWPQPNSLAQVVFSDRRHQHLQQVNAVKTGDQLQAGVLGGQLGTARVLEHTAKFTRLELNLNSAPPPPLPLILILALPRPRMLARSLQHLSALGVKKLILLHSARVEKSYWQSPELGPEKIRHNLILGLEQAKDTLLPEVHLRQQFKPFVEDELAELTAACSLKLVAHPGDFELCPRGVTQPSCLAIGPEGGWVDFEVELLRQQGFTPVQLGPRILRVETAVTALLARMF